MSDFFDRLLNTSQEAAQRVTPLPVSVYEPVHPPADPAWGALDQDGKDQPGPALFAPPRAQPAAPAGAPSPPPTADDGLRRRLAELQSWLGSIASQLPGVPRESQLGQPPPPPERPRTAPRSTLTPVPEKASQQHTSAQPPAPGSSAPPPRHDQQPALLIREVALRPSAPGEQSRERETPPRQPGLPSASASRLAPPGPAAPPPERSIERIETVRLEPRRVEHALLPELASLHARQAPQPPPRPVVHVTIGRLEVRAARQPAQAPVSAPRPSAPQPMSLEEYLRKRSEGGRR